MIYIGIDPGKKGGFGAIEEVGILVKPWDNAFFIEYCRGIYRAGTKAVACVEKVGAMPGQGVTSMFSFGKSAGFIEGVLQAYGIPYQLITPQKWKKEFSLGHTKEDSITVCKRLFPSVKLLPTDRCKKESDGMAEALLMAEYARRKF